MVCVINPTVQARLPVWLTTGLGMTLAGLLANVVHLPTAEEVFGLLTPGLQREAWNWGGGESKRFSDAVPANEAKLRFSASDRAGIEPVAEVVEAEVTETEVTEPQDPQ